MLEIVHLKGHHCHLFVMDLSCCSALLSVDQVSRHVLQSLLGVMSFVTACLYPARIFMSTLLNTLHEHRSARVCPLSTDSKADLRWWCHFLPFYNSVSPIKTSPLINNPLYLSTDACSTGAGGFFNGQYFHTPFPHSILQCFKHNINILEFPSIMVALKLWGASLRGQCLLIQCNDENSVFAVNSGPSHSPGIQLCLREIWFLSAFIDFEISAVHIPGRTNTIADHLSCWHLSPSHQERFFNLTADFNTTPVACPLSSLISRSASSIVFPFPSQGILVLELLMLLRSRVHHFKTWSPGSRLMCTLLGQREISILIGILFTTFVISLIWFRFLPHLRQSPATRRSYPAGCPPFHISSIT